MAASVAFDVGPIWSSPDFGGPSAIDADDAADAEEEARLAAIASDGTAPPARPSAANGGVRTARTPSGAPRALRLPDNDDEDDARRLRATFVSSLQPQGIRTVGDAVAVVEQAIERQIDVALEEGIEPNVGAAGDAEVRRGFLLLLPDAQQRLVFLRTVAQPRSWPRVRSLFGAPPYHFLHPRDGDLLRAAGFARNRANMAYTTHQTANVAQFGAQLIDEYTREYRVVGADVDDATLLPSRDYFEDLGDQAVALQVKVRKRRIAAKRELLRSDEKARLLFPRPGERIELQPSEFLRSALRDRGPWTVALVVQVVRPRAAHANTAAVLAKLV